MKLIWSTHAWEDYLYWQENDKKNLRRINELTKATQREPFNGIGDPEPLRHQWKGYWSRRINREHRLIYKAQGDELWICQCRYHY